LVKTNEVVEEVEVRLESCLNVEPIVSPLLGTLELDIQLEEATPSKLSGETSLETNTVRKKVLVEIDRKIGVDTPSTMA